MYWETLKSCDSDIITTSLRLKYNDCDLKPEIGYGKVLTFILDDILEMLPNHIDHFDFIVKKNGYPYSIEYSYENDEFEDIYHGEYGQFIEAAYQMLVWCIKNGHIKTNKNERV